MSRGGWYRGDDGASTVHLLFGPGVKAPAPCAAPCIEGDNAALFGGRCARIGGRLCDAPVGETIGGKPITCDKPLCKRHATSGGPEIDYCPDHASIAPGRAEA